MTVHYIANKAEISPEIFLFGNAFSFLAFRAHSGYMYYEHRGGVYG